MVLRGMATFWEQHFSRASSVGANKESQKLFLFVKMAEKKTGPGCSKLTMWLVNVSLNFQKLISQICQYFLLKKCEKLLQCKSFSHLFNKKLQCIWL